MPIEDQVIEVLTTYKHLVFDENSNSFSGEILLPDSDSYEVIIDLDTYPTFFPKVYEIGGRIPHKVERHIFPDSKNCCFTTNAKSQILLKTKIKTLKIFIKEIVIPYLQNNSYYEINNEYYTDEHSHNYFGIIEGYADILRIDNLRQLYTTILQAINNEKLNIHQDCYCGSERKLRKCTNGKHLKYMRHLFLIDKGVLINDFKHFDELINTIIN